MIRLLYIDVNSLREKKCQIRLTFEGQDTNHIYRRPAVANIDALARVRTSCKGTLSATKKLNLLHCTTKILQN